MDKDLVFNSSETFAEDFLEKFVLEFNELKKEFIKLQNQVNELQYEVDYLRSELRSDAFKDKGYH